MNRPIFVIALLLSVAPTLSLDAQGSEQRVGGTDSNWRKSDGSFQAMMHFSSDPDDFLAQWGRPPSPDYAPELKTPDSVRRGDLVVAFVFFTGCSADSAGLCNVTADLVVLAPDGSEYARVDDAEVWTGKAPPPEPYMQLAAAYLGIIIEPQDLLGEYTVTANVCDQVGETCLDLSQSFDAVHRLATFDFDQLMDTYYLDPRPEFVGLFIGKLSDRGVLENPDSAPPAIAFLAEVFAANPEKVSDWETTIEAQPEPTRTRLFDALKLSGDPGAIRDINPPSPSLNDMFWGAYFASGNTQYLDAIIEKITLSDDRVDLNNFLVGGSAKWSLSSNIRNHLRVKQHVEARLLSSEESTRIHLTEVIEKSPSELRSEMIEQLRAQHDAGVW